MTISALPTIPSRNQDPATFVANADAFLAALPTFRTEANALAVTVDANTTLSTTNANTSTTKAAEAAASAVAAISAANVAVWVSGTTYAQYICVISPANYLTYRRKVAGAGTTDPSADGTNWVVVANNTGLGGTAITGNVTLTSSSDAAMTVTPSTHGLYITLPAATTCVEASLLFSIYNAGDYDYGVKDSAGTQLGWIRPRTGAVIGLSDSSTSAGVWAYYGLEKVGITASKITSSLTGVDAGIIAVELDSDRTCYLFGQTNCYGIVYNSATCTWGSASLIRATIQAVAYRAILSTTDQVLVISSNTTTGVEAVTLTISGTGITVNSGTKATATLAGNYAAFSQLVSVPAQSAFVIGYGRATNMSAIRAITISGTTPTISSELALLTTTAEAPIMFVSGSVVRTVNATSTLLTATPATISGSSTPVAGTPVNETTTAANIRATINGNGNIVCQYINTNHCAAIFKLTGTVEASSTAILNGVSVPSVTTYTDYAHIGSNKTVFIASVNNAFWYANILTDTAGTVSVGTQITGPWTASVSTNAHIGTSGNNVRFAVGTTASLGQITLDCSSTSPVLSSVSSLYSAGVSSPLPSDKYGVMGTRQLSTGSTFYTIGGATYRDATFTTNTIQTRNPVSVGANVTSGDVGYHANNKKSYSGGIGSSAFVITRVEAAA
jgi:hypothetical protein